MLLSLSRTNLILYLLIVPEGVLRHCRRHAYDWPYSDNLILCNFCFSVSLVAGTNLAVAMDASAAEGVLTSLTVPE